MLLLPAAVFLEVASLEFYFGDTRDRTFGRTPVPGRHLCFMRVRAYAGNAASPSRYKVVDHIKSYNFYLESISI